MRCFMSATARRKILDAAWTVAREQGGVAALTMREVADRVGIRAPSLYSHFDSKHAIYDAMFGESWQELLDVNRAAELPKSPRAALRVIARTYFDFATADLARHQLLDVRTIPGFMPSAQSYAPAITALDEGIQQMAARGIRVDARGHRLVHRGDRRAGEPAMGQRPGRVPLGTSARAGHRHVCGQHWTAPGGLMT